MKSKFILINTRKCICCNENFLPHEYEIAAKGICLCRDCDKKADRFSSKAIFRGRNNLRFVMSAFPYSGILRTAFGKYKFYGEVAYGDIFSKLLIKEFADIIDGNDFDMLIPVPISSLRFKERGFNQTALIARPLAEKLNIAYSENALFRIKNTKKQSLLSVLQRSENVKNAFMSNSEIVYGKSILLFDDIYTVGATMNECALSLLKSGAQSVAGASLFKTLIPDGKSEKTKTFF